MNVPDAGTLSTRGVRNEQIVAGLGFDRLRARPDQPLQRLFARRRGPEREDSIGSRKANASIPSSSS